MNHSRHLTQLRNKDSKGPLYSPQRDLAWIYAPAMREAVLALDQVNWSDDIKQICDQCGITEDDISQAVGKLTEAHRYLVNFEDVKQPLDALNKVGWYDTHPAARYLIYGRLGEVMLGGFFLALRDTSQFADESSQAKEIADFIAIGKLVMERGSGAAASPTEVAEMRQQKHRVDLELRGCRDALALAQNERDGFERLYRSKEQALKQTTENMNHRDRIIKVVRNLGFWRWLWLLFKSPGARGEWLNEQADLLERTSSPS